jgi:hypothetical protein
VLKQEQIINKKTRTNKKRPQDDWPAKQENLDIK